MAGLSLKNICKVYPNGFQAVKDFNLEIADQEFIIFVGPSGCGKSTTLRMIAGLEEISSGELKIGDRVVNDVEPKDRDIAMVFQNYALYPHMSVYDNMAFGLKLRKVPKDEIDKMVKEAAKILDLTALLDRKPKALSGGQRQRVAFARALAPNPSLLLLDEPFAAIDAKVRQELRTWLRKMIYKVGITSIFVTHDQDEAVEVADQIIVTNKGRIEQIGSPLDIYKTPQTPFVTEFIGQSTVIEDYHRFNGFGKGNYQGAVIRPEFVEVFKRDNREFSNYIDLSEEGEIIDILFRGNSLELTIDLHGVMITAHRSLERKEVKVGEKVRVLIYRLFAFDEDRAYLLENENLKGKNINIDNLESYLYNEEYDFFVI